MKINQDKISRIHHDNVSIDSRVFRAAVDVRRITTSTVRAWKAIPLSYQVLTACIFLPLAFAFAFQVQFYPISFWNLFTEAVSLGEGRTYYILRGRKSDGKWIDIPPIALTDALSGRNFTMLSYVLENSSFYCDSPHPNNIRFRGMNGRSDKSLPTGARIPELLRAWGRVYNDKVLGNPQQELKIIRLDGYRWSGNEYGDFQAPAGGWQVRL